MRRLAVSLVALAGSNTLGGVVSFAPDWITVDPETIFTPDLAIESSESRSQRNRST